MKKFLANNFAVRNVTIDGQRVIDITVAPSNLRDWCLCLQLLQESIVEGFILSFGGPTGAIDITRGHVSDWDTCKADNRINLTLADHDLGRLRMFFLRYYRDGYAAVDHVDIETPNGDYITVTVHESAPPVSAEEAKRRLGV